MRKYTRQRIVLDIIENNEVKTQEELSEMLLEKGVNATQSTISRDIKELKITKVQTKNGEYKYAALERIYDSMNERLEKICRLSVLSIEHNGDIILVKTISHTAAVCSARITNSKISGISGMVSGVDTIFIVVDDKNRLDEIVEELRRFVK